MKIIFMGTSSFAAPVLQKLINTKEHQITAVFTARPAPMGRGMQVRLSPVHELALHANLPVFTPLSLRNEETKSLIDSIEADIIVVVAYGLIIPSSILEMKKFGSVNIHPSDLPKYRGAAPLQRIIMNGEVDSAVCIIQMDKGIDTGPILKKEKLPIEKNITLLDLQNKTSQIGSKLLLELLDEFQDIKNFFSQKEQENLEIDEEIRKLRLKKAVAQSSQGASYADKLNKEEGRVNWKESSEIIERKLRAMTPWPGLYFFYKDIMFKILEAKHIASLNNLANEFDRQAGEILTENLTIACGNGFLQITKIQQQGKKPLDVDDFLRGTSMPKGTKLD